MKISRKQLQEIVKEAIRMRGGVETAPAPTIKPAEPRTKPREEPDVRPNPLAPPREAPKTRPKGMVREEEKEIIGKIANRFAKLKGK